MYMSVIIILYKTSDYMTFFVLEHKVWELHVKAGLSDHTQCLTTKNVTFDNIKTIKNNENINVYLLKIQIICRKTKYFEKKNNYSMGLSFNHFFFFHGKNNTFSKNYFDQQKSDEFSFKKNLKERPMEYIFFFSKYFFFFAYNL